jgi:hypothetical protein
MVERSPAAAGFPRKTLTLRDTDEANARLVAEILGDVLDSQAIEDLTPGIIWRARIEREGGWFATAPWKTPRRNVRCG